MSKLGKIIGDLLIQAAHERHHSAGGSTSRIVFVGPPIEWLKSALEEIEIYYTNESGKNDDLTYALIDSENNDLGWRHSDRINGVRFITAIWQYAVKLREPNRRLIIMCDPTMWSTVIESIENSS